MIDFSCVFLYPPAMRSDKWAKWASHRRSFPHDQYLIYCNKNEMIFTCTFCIVAKLSLSPQLQLLWLVQLALIPLDPALTQPHPHRPIHPPGKLYLLFILYPHFTTFMQIIFFICMVAVVSGQNVLWKAIWCTIVTVSISQNCPSNFPPFSVMKLYVPYIQLKHHHYLIIDKILQCDEGVQRCKLCGHLGTSRAGQKIEMSKINKNLIKFNWVTTH